jgi:hypothetical protein
MGSEGITPPFLTWALNGDQWSASRPGRFALRGKNPQYPLGIWVGSRAGLDVLENTKILPLPGIEPRPSSQWSVAIPTELSRRDSEEGDSSIMKVNNTLRNSEFVPAPFKTRPIAPFYL